MDLPVAIFLVVGCPFSVLLMFLPTFLELRKPIDAGPRMILGNEAGQKSAMKTIASGTIVHKPEFGLQGKTLGGALSVLADIEI